MEKGQGEEEATGEETCEHGRNIEQKRRISLLGMQEWEYVPSF